MGEIISFAEYLRKREADKLRCELIQKMSTKLTKDESDLTVLQLVDLFCQQHQPDFYWRFDLFIKGKL